jgi:hypothetical protein
VKNGTESLTAEGQGTFDRRERGERRRARGEMRRPKIFNRKERKGKLAKFAKSSTEGSTAEGQGTFDRRERGEAQGTRRNAESENL